MVRKMANYCIGFTTKKGLCLDLDNLPKRKVRQLTETLLKKHKLEGYLIIKSSQKNYHVVFNKYLSWRKTLQILSTVYSCFEWMLWQIRKGEITLRVSTKKGKNRPKIIFQKGQTDKLINDYLLIYKMFEEY